MACKMFELSAHTKQDLFGLKLSDFQTVYDRREFIRAKLRTSRPWNERAVLVLYEQWERDLPNFYVKDRGYLMHIAKQLRGGTHLTDEQCAAVSKRTINYAHMLELLARTKAVGGLPC